MIVSKEIHKLIKDQEGWTRRMFEEGIRIKKLYGEDSVYDFSLGNPDTEPPEALSRALIDAVANPAPGMHRYMSNSWYEEVRSDIAEYLREERGLPFTSGHVFMTAGCAGGLNMILRSILNRGDEVIVPSPFFWEFKNYIKNAGGRARFVETTDDFQLDVGRIESAITPKTRAILINSPNNPTGAVYTEEGLRELAGLLNRKREQGQDIFIISDEAYKMLVYDGIRLPNLFDLYDLVLAVTSHSKDLALAGERIGYIANSAANTVSVVNLTNNNTLLATIPVGTPAAFYRIKR